MTVTHDPPEGRLLPSAVLHRWGIGQGRGTVIDVATIAPDALGRALLAADARVRELEAGADPGAPGATAPRHG